MAAFCFLFSFQKWKKVGLRLTQQNGQRLPAWKFSVLLELWKLRHGKTQQNTKQRQDQGFPAELRQHSHGKSKRLKRANCLGLLKRNTCLEFVPGNSFPKRKKMLKSRERRIAKCGSSEMDAKFGTQRTIATDLATSEFLQVVKLTLSQSGWKYC